VTAIYGAGELRVVANGHASAPCRVARWSRFGADRYWSVDVDAAGTLPTQLVVGRLIDFYPRRHHDLPVAASLVGRREEAMTPTRPRHPCCCDDA